MRRENSSRVELNVLGIVAVMAFVYFLGSARLSTNALIKREEELTAEISQVDEQIELLRTEVDRPFDEEYIEEVAHSYGYVYPQEVVYHRSDGN